MTIKDDLIAAKALIDTPEKWGKGWYENEAGCLCALGATAKAITGIANDQNWGENPRLRAAQRSLEAALPRYWYVDGVAAFNDSARRKHADIMALFDRAIEAQS